MKSKHFLISVEEFELMEHPFGWKAEYFSGMGHLTPRDQIVQTRLALRPQTRTAHWQKYQLIPIDPSLTDLTIAAFFEAFQDSVEFCNWPLDEIYAHAVKNINNYFQGVRGNPHSVSKVVVEPIGQQIVGLALFVINKEEKVELDLLSVKPSHQRKGIATQMVASAIDSLYADGIREIRSGYHICNEVSRAWHHSLGFVEIPDFLFCRLKAAWYRDKIWRGEKLGVTERLDEFATEQDRWTQLAEESLVIKIAKRQSQGLGS
jgi:GNAT superfamily N-acetyltransferase